MDQKEMDLLTFSIGFLAGQLETGELKSDRFEEYVFDELSQSKPLDGEPHFEKIPAVQELLEFFMIRLVPILLSKNWTKERMINLSSKFGELIALGKVTPTTIAVLTNTPVEELEHHCRKFGH